MRVEKLIWFFVGVCVALGFVIWLKGCDREKIEEEVVEVKEIVRRDTVYLKGGIEVKYVRDNSLEDSLEVYKFRFDSLEKNKVIIVKENTKETIKYVTIADSSSIKLIEALGLENGDKIMKLPAMVEVKDSGGRWLRLRVLLDEKPEFLGGDIVSNLVKKDSLVKDNFWVKEWEVMYRQDNPYLNKVDIRYKYKERKYKILKFLKIKK